MLCTRPEQYRHSTNGCVNSCVNSPEDGPVGPKHAEIRQYINKIEIVTSVGFNSIYRNIVRTTASSKTVGRYMAQAVITHWRLRRGGPGAIPGQSI